MSGYDIISRRTDEISGLQRYRDYAECLRTGVCPDPSFYFSTDSKWLEIERRSWASRQRTRGQPEDAVRFCDQTVETDTWRSLHRDSPGRPGIKGGLGAMKCPENRS